MTAVADHGPGERWVEMAQRRFVYRSEGDACPWERDVDGGGDCSIQDQVQPSSKVLNFSGCEPNWSNEDLRSALSSARQSR